MLSHRTLHRRRGGGQRALDAEPVPTPASAPSPRARLRREPRESRESEPRERRRERPADDLPRGSFAMDPARAKELELSLLSEAATHVERHGWPRERLQGWRCAAVPRLSNPADCDPYWARVPGW